MITFVRKNVSFSLSIGRSDNNAYFFLESISSGTINELFVPYAPRTSITTNQLTGSGIVPTNTVQILRPITVTYNVIVANNFCGTKYKNTALREAQNFMMFIAGGIDMCVHDLEENGDAGTSFVCFNGYIADDPQISYAGNTARLSFVVQYAEPFVYSNYLTQRSVGVGVTSTTGFVPVFKNCDVSYVSVLENNSILSHSILSSPLTVPEDSVLLFGGSGAYLFNINSLTCKIEKNYTSGAPYMPLGEYVVRSDCSSSVFYMADAFI